MYCDGDIFQFSNSDLGTVPCLLLVLHFMSICEVLYCRLSVSVESLFLFRRKWFSWRCHWEMLLFIAWTIWNFICGNMLHNPISGYSHK